LSIKLASFGKATAGRLAAITVVGIV